jgi:hypothetical protein
MWLALVEGVVATYNRPRMSAVAPTRHDSRRRPARRALRTLALLGVVAALLPASRAPAQPAAPVAHEFFVYSSGAGTPPPDLPALPQPGAGDPEMTAPTAPRYGAGGLRAEPGGEGTWAPPERNGSFDPALPAGLDDETGPEPWLNYAAVFDPTVAPWKRGTARDRAEQVAGSLGMVLADPTLGPIAIGGAPSPGDATFTGRVRVDLRAGVPVAIPSVAPGMRVHRVDASPPVAVSIEADAADNFHVRSEFNGPVDLTLAVSAPTIYFGGRAPIDAASIAVPAEGDPRRRVAAAAGLTDGMRRDEALALLVRHFRAFAAEPLDAATATGDLYLDVSLQQRGVCRHRAIAFTVTALAVGIEARYVHNEAHAFAEARVGGHWRRIDLGGAADGMQLSGADDAPRHDAGPDPWGGEADPYTMARRDGPASSPEHGEGDGAGSDDGAGALDGAAGTAGGSADGPADPAQATPRVMADLPGRDARPLGPQDIVRMRTSVRLEAAPAFAWAGDSLDVRGRLLDVDGAGVRDAVVTVWLGPSDERHAEAAVFALGSLEVDRNGAFAGSVLVPPETPVGDWGVYVVYAGGPAYEPSRSE